MRIHLEEEKRRKNKEELREWKGRVFIELSAFLAPIPPRVISRPNRGSYGNRARDTRPWTGSAVLWIAPTYFLRGPISSKNKQLELGGPSLSWHHSRLASGWFPSDSSRFWLPRREDLQKGRRSLGSNMHPCVYVCTNRAVRCCVSTRTNACINASINSECEWIKRECGNSEVW